MSTNPIVEADDLVIEEGSNNVYADIGYANPQEMLVKARLATKIAEIINKRHLKQHEAAALLGMTQPKVSALLRGQFRGISEAKLIDCLNRLGRDVEIVIRKAPRAHAAGQTNVVYA